MARVWSGDAVGCVYYMDVDGIPAQLPEQWMGSLQTERFFWRLRMCEKSAAGWK